MLRPRSKRVIGFSAPVCQSGGEQGLNLQKTPDCLGKTRSDAPISAPISPDSADLQKIIRAWPELSEPLRRAILVIVHTATHKGGQ